MSQIQQTSRTDISSLPPFVPRIHPKYLASTDGGSVARQPSSEPIFRRKSGSVPRSDASVPFGLSGNVLGDFVKFLVDILIEKTGCYVWARRAPPNHKRPVLEETFSRLLESYALGLEAAPPRNSKFAPGFAQVVADIVRYCKADISKDFWTRVPPAGSVPSLQTYHYLDDFFKKYLVRSHDIEAPDTSQLDSDSVAKEPSRSLEGFDGHEEKGRAIKLARPTLTQGEAFGTLVTVIRRKFYQDDLFTMRQIERQLKDCLCQDPKSSGEISVLFELDWKPSEFFESQFEGRIPRIGTLVTLTGSAFYAQATTCAEYLRRTWPATWELFLSSLQSVLDSKVMPVASNNSPDHSSEIINEYKICFAIRKDKMLSVMVQGPLKTIIEVAQQLSWISAALSSSPFKGEMAYCRVDMDTRRANMPGAPRQIGISRDFFVLGSVETPCWLQLFSNATVVQGFPIPQRLGETGLEISIELMAAITGASHAVEYSGGVVMKGFSSMFIPIKRDEEINTVQWHLVSSQNKETRLSYQEGVSHCPNRILLAEFDLQLLQTTRAIVGWCRTVETVLGRECINYENIDYSMAGEVTRSLKIKNAAVGFQQFGLAQIEFTLGPKDGSCHFQRQGPYKRIINAAGKTYVVLFDTGERLGWLVPASGVLLHIASHRSRLNQMASFRRGASFEEQLLVNESVDLFNDGKYSFKDMITQVWSKLEVLVDQRVSVSTSSGFIVPKSLRDSLVGYEFKAIVEDRSPLRVKEFAVENTSGGWPSLVRDIDALVLFASGFEDLIRPADVSSGLCHMWKTVPKGKDYLATTVQTLNDLYDVAGCRLNKQYLTSSHLQWHRGDSVLFEDCCKPGDLECRCSRLQQIVAKNSRRNVVPPGPLTNEGGIIFGRSSTWLRDRRKTVPSTASKSGLYSQPNIPLSAQYDGSEEGNTASPSLDGATPIAVSIHTNLLTSISEISQPDDDASEGKHENIEAQYYGAPLKGRSIDQDLEQDVSQLLNLPTPHKQPQQVQ
ncbi:hypothetical protein NUW58_g7188 [Xylaria curta]|uniref:Uncharacterized protein n=1 Tax=Xylaria curta TaxID=42375 RepID=A0ACC1NKK6_9PEZI|nr:hypothetical protein NUW58_g7188 [Xylaria curta]